VTAKPIATRDLPRSEISSDMVTGDSPHWMPTRLSALHAAHVVALRLEDLAVHGYLRAVMPTRMCEAER
jgi:hypothetical protein